MVVDRKIRRFCWRLTSLRGVAALNTAQKDAWGRAIGGFFPAKKGIIE